MKFEVNDSIFKFYFYFIQERMNIFWKKYHDEPRPWTKDSIFLKYKFTNVYRVTDRVSQFLVNKVIYQDSERSLLEEDVVLRILLFKIFNRIETWEYIENQVGFVRVKNFNVSLLSDLLTQRISETPIFSNAYMMTGSHRKYKNYMRKHEKWLHMVEEEILKEHRIQKIIQAKTLEDIYLILRECSFLGEFLAYQYSIDLNYSPVINFDENSFVKAGIGAIRGIKKCFIKSDKFSFDDAIKFTFDNFEYYQEKYGMMGFNNLFGRNPSLIDIQNCFCETDKYLRAKMPEMIVDNTRIKQKYSQTNNKIDWYFPPKWELCINS